MTTTHPQAESPTQKRQRLKQHANALPNRPGIYKMLDKSGEILYVGKAKSLKIVLVAILPRPSNTQKPKHWYNALNRLRLSSPVVKPKPCY